MASDPKETLSTSFFKFELDLRSFSAVPGALKGPTARTHSVRKLLCDCLLVVANRMRKTEVEMEKNI